MSTKRRRAPIPRLTHLDRARRRNAESLSLSTVLAYGLLTAILFVLAAGLTGHGPLLVPLVVFALTVMLGDR